MDAVSHAIDVLNRGTLLVVLIAAFSAAASAEDSAAFYKANCAACHSIGQGPRVGPDLKGVTQRKDRAWLVRFIQNPKAMVDSGDVYAKQILSESHGFVMPTLPGMDREHVEDLLRYIENEGRRTTSKLNSASSSPAQRATADDVAQDRNVIVGQRALTNGGAPCISCHTISNLPSLGGGRLGPDLTHSVARLGGRDNMGAWLQTPPTPTMRAAYKDHALQSEEIHAIVAYLDSADKEDPAHAAANEQWPSGSFLLIGLGGSLAVLAVMELLWHHRFRSVRHALVTAKKGRVS